LSLTEPVQVGARRVTFDVSIQIAARILNLILGIFVTLILVRGLGTRGFGIWSAMFAVAQVASSFGDLGLNQIAISRAAEDPDREDGWLGALLSLRLLLAIPITLFSVGAILLIAPTSQARLAGALIAGVMLMSAPAALTVVFQLRVRNHVPMAILTLNSVLWGAGVVVVSALSGGIVAFAAVLLATSALTAGLTATLALKRAAVRIRGSRDFWSPLLRVGVGVGVAGILVTLYVKLDQILVLELAGSRQAGLYGAAYRLLDQVQFIPISVMTTLFPLIAAAYASHRDKVRALLQMAAEYLAMASLPILAFTIVAARPIMTLLFGSDFAAAAPALPVLAGAFVSISFGYLVGNMVVILELQRQFAGFAAIGLIINGALNVILIPRFGFLAAAWITLLTEVTVMSSSMRIVLRKLEMRPRFGRLLRTLLAATLMGVAVWIAKLAGAPLGGLVVVSAASYLPCLYLLRVVTIAELLAVRRGEPSVTVD
jgi:O-antigen/teichoic acid export membrane protein